MRNKRGQFAKGYTGNASGRPKKADEQYLVDLWTEHGQKSAGLHSGLCGLMSRNIHLSVMNGGPLKWLLELATRCWGNATRRCASLLFQRRSLVADQSLDVAQESVARHALDDPFRDLAAHDEDEVV